MERGVVGDKASPNVLGRKVEGAAERSPPGPASTRLRPYAALGGDQGDSCPASMPTASQSRGVGVFEYGREEMMSVALRGRRGPSGKIAAGLAPLSSTALGIRVYLSRSKR